jgi:hypothetical protein
MLSPRQPSATVRLLPYILIHKPANHQGFTDCRCAFSYRIHLTPGSRRNSASARTQILAGNKQMNVLPPAPETPLDSPPITPPALELAVVPHVYSASEPSPPLSASPYPSVPEYVKQDYQDAATAAYYFDPRGSRRAFDPGPLSSREELLSPTCPSVAMRDLRRDACDNASGNEHGPFPPKDHIYVPSSGALVMTGSHAINGLSNTATHAMYGTFTPSTHSPPKYAPPTQSSNASMCVDVSLDQQRPRGHPIYAQGQPLRTSISSSQLHMSPITPFDSPSPVPSLSQSSQGSEHSPHLLYQKHEFSRAISSGMTDPPRGPPRPTQIQASSTENYHFLGLIPSGDIYGRGSTTAPWQNLLSDARGMHGGVGFVL